MAKLMKISCPYCGRVHDRDYDCGRRPNKIYSHHDSRASHFRSSRAWRDKSEAIRDRDKYLCQVCLRNLFDTEVQFNGNNLSVHHIVPIEKDFSKRLDDNNLITLCSKHHEMAEAGLIPEYVLLAIAKDQESQIIAT